MRVTMNTIMRNYNERLSRVMYETSRSMARVTNGRLFEKPSENPSGSVRSVQLRRLISNNENYIANLRDTIGKYDVAEATMLKISNLAEDVHVALVAALNEVNSRDELIIYAAQIRSIQEQMVLDANARFADAYLYGGSSTKEPPFKFENGVLYFRGIDVMSGDPMLDKLADEKIYVDFGFGMRMDPTAPDPNEVVRGTAFNTAFPGIHFLGYGYDADGNNNNIILLLGEIADALEDPNYTHEPPAKLLDQLAVLRKRLLVNITQMGSATMFMNFTEKRLTDIQFNYEGKLASTEFMDTEYAITLYEMQYTAYMAALKMGPNVITPSFIDFMR